MRLVQLGTVIPLATRLEDGNQDVYIKAVLSNDEGTVVQTESLSITPSGLFLSSAMTAYDEGIFYLTYFVYRDSLMTILDKRYAQKVETIRVENIQETIINSIDFGDGRVT